MPQEWNKVSTFIREYKGRTSSIPYQQVEAYEESEPELFVNPSKQEWPHLEQLHHQATVAQQLEKDKMDDCLRKLVDRFEKPVETAKKETV